jgi:hypothetical protein
MLSFEEKDYISTSEINIISNKLNKKELKHIKKIRFADSMPKFILESNYTDLSMLVETKNNAAIGEIEIIDDVIFAKNIVLFKSFTYMIVKYIVGYVLKIDIKNIIFRYCGYDDEFASMLSIGTSKLDIIINASNEIFYGNYENNFYKQYYNTAMYVKSCISRKLKPVAIHPVISKMAFSAMLPYQTYLHIPKLFNQTHIKDDFRKITMHSDTEDTFKQKPRPYQYLKTGKYVSNVWKGISSKYNTVSIYIGMELSIGIILSRIEIFINGTVNFIFTNTNSSNTSDVISDVCKSWIDANGLNYMKRLKLNECVYSFEFEYTHYTFHRTSISLSLIVNGINYTQIDSISGLFIEPSLLKSSVKTKTSITFNGYDFNNPGTRVKYEYINKAHEFITQSLVSKEFLCAIHIGAVTDSDLAITISDVFNLDEAFFMLQLILPQFSSFNSDSVSALAKYDMSVKSLRTKYKSMNHKAALKLLIDSDPSLFGNRIIPGVAAPRAFSSLCQKVEQRVVRISDSEYNYLKKEIPESVTNVQNQTIPTQRLYLFCPYERFGFLNFHHFPNQMCIVRCTAKASNKTQYIYCADSLESEYRSTINNKYENQTITLYNPFITKGRRCKVPEEMKNAIINYYLLKLNILTGLQKYCRTTYNKDPFIIRRDPLSNTYLILNEYDPNLDYVLILQSETNEDYMIFLNLTNNAPLIFSENVEIKSFFVQRISKTSTQYSFFKFIEKTTGIELEAKMNLNVRELFTYLTITEHLIFIIYEKYIHGFISNNKIYMSPKIYWTFDSEVYTIKIYEAMIESKNGKYSFPTINEFHDINVVYEDYTSKMIQMIDYNGTKLLIEPVEYTSTIPKILFDYNAVIVNMLNINFETKELIKTKQIVQANVGRIVNIYFVLCEGEYGNKIFSENIIELVEEFLQKHDVLTPNNTFIEYIDRKSRDFISWRTSKINIDDYRTYFGRNVINMVTDLNKLYYDILTEALNITLTPNETLYEKIITI